LDTFKFDVALIASIVTCPEHASIGAHLPCDLELGLAFRDERAPAAAADLLARHLRDAQVRPVSMSRGVPRHKKSSAL